MDQQTLRQIEIPLEELASSTRGIRGCLLATADGVAVTHRNLNDQAEALAALSASSLGIGRRVAEVGGCGALQEVCFKGFEGWVSVVAVGNRAVLAAVAYEGCSIGMVMYYSRKYADEILGILDPEQARALEERKTPATKRIRAACGAPCKRWLRSKATAHRPPMTTIRSTATRKNTVPCRSSRARARPGGNRSRPARRACSPKTEERPARPGPLSKCRSELLRGCRAQASATPPSVSLRGSRISARCSGERSVCSAATSFTLRPSLAASFATAAPFS